jgi:hypothetical protein
MSLFHVIDPNETPYQNGEMLGVFDAADGLEMADLTEWDPEAARGYRAGYAFIRGPLGADEEAMLRGLIADVRNDYFGEI